MDIYFINFSDFTMLMCVFKQNKNKCNLNRGCTIFCMNIERVPLGILKDAKKHLLGFTKYQRPLPP